ncbi:MAG: flavin reductase family protein [Zestosphaera sp.]
MQVFKYVTRVMHPRPVSIVVSRSRDGKVNGCAVAWFMPVNVDPFMFAITLSPRRLTYEYIKESGEVTLNVIPYRLAEAAHRAGSVSGREVEDKLTKFGFELEPSVRVGVPHIKGVPAYAEGLLRNELQFSDRSLMVFECVHVHVDEKYFKDGAFTEDTEVLLHVGGNTYARPCRYVRID